MCNVRAEDSGEIKFVARHVETVALLDVEGSYYSPRKEPKWFKGLKEHICELSVHILSVLFNFVSAYVPLPLQNLL